MKNNSNDADKVIQETTSEDDADFSIADATEFNNKLRHDPDSIGDNEIRDQYGYDIDVNAVREAFRRSTFNRPPKNQRASARAKLRRRLLWLQQAISDVEAAIEAVLAAPGRTNKSGELEDLRKSIAELRTKTGLAGNGQPGVDDADLSMFDKLFNLPSPTPEISQRTPNGEKS